MVGPGILAHKSYATIPACAHFSRNRACEYSTILGALLKIGRLPQVRGHFSHNKAAKLAVQIIEFETYKIRARARPAGSIANVELSVRDNGGYASRVRDGASRLRGPRRQPHVQAAQRQFPATQIPIPVRSVECDDDLGFRHAKVTQRHKRKGAASLQPLVYLARPAELEPTNIPLEISRGNRTAQLVVPVLLEHRPDHAH